MSMRGVHFTCLWQEVYNSSCRVYALTPGYSVTPIFSPKTTFSANLHGKLRSNGARYNDGLY